jgi:putative membrane protein
VSAFGPDGRMPSTWEDGMEQFLNDIRPWLLLSTLIYAIIGMLVFGLAFALFNKLMPFSVRKEIEEDQNTALGIVIGAFLIGLSIIIAAAIV